MVGQSGWPPLEMVAGGLSPSNYFCTLQFHEEIHSSMEMGAGRVSQPGIGGGEQLLFATLKKCNQKCEYFKSLITVFRLKMKTSKIHIWIASFCYCLREDHPRSSQLATTDYKCNKQKPTELSICSC